MHLPVLDSKLIFILACSSDDLCCFSEGDLKIAEKMHVGLGFYSSCFLANSFTEPHNAPLTVDARAIFVSNVREIKGIALAVS